MNSDMEDNLRKVNCCACQKPMAGSRYVNVICLDRRATWKDPAWTNVLLKEGIPRVSRAVAVMCDSCIEQKKEARFAIELRDGEIIYHDIGELEELFPIKPEMLEE